MENCIKCGKPIYGSYHCITCCRDISDPEALKMHIGECPRAVFLNPIQQ